MQQQAHCPVCASPSGLGDIVGDHTTYICPKCGTYKLAGTVVTEWKNGTLEKPTPEEFRALVKRKRGSSSEYPLITTYDLGR